MNAGVHSNVDEAKQNARLLNDLHKFVRSRVPTTDEILEEFPSSVSATDAAVFRNLLKSVATLKDGRWFLKKPKPKSL